ncbi:Isochorismatase domain-containing 2 [Micractinium conductrix]|uniref:Isochorismatase domain-containing 2 n=1 Tax=Micractinium conductrix TaxID=554055 RepID=A0A2P6VGK8_9CHLO|nr:Isochorismatase domain-containing 2 [Micractinium conductrix]|eukprot:PSC73207.1 Isochorismatase domain-containing 2 [Micractinium conductrix]
MPAALRVAALTRHLLGQPATAIAARGTTVRAMAAAADGRSVGRLPPDETALLVCDVQERFRPVISGFPAVVDTSRRMLRAASALQLPVIVTEQYPKALGNTVEELQPHIPPGSPVVAKTLFSMCTDEVNAALEGLPAVKKVLIVGIETHVCVLQTCLDLLERGYEVHIVVDGVSSQRLGDRSVALQRLAQAGAFLATSEMVMFQMMRNTGHPAFKAVSALCKEERPEQLPAA